MVVNPQHLGEVPGYHIVHNRHDFAVNLLAVVTKVLKMEEGRRGRGGRGIRRDEDRDEDRRGRRQK